MKVITKSLVSMQPKNVRGREIKTALRDALLPFQIKPTTKEELQSAVIDTLSRFCQSPDHKQHIDVTVLALDHTHFEVHENNLFTLLLLRGAVVDPSILGDSDEYTHQGIRYKLTRHKDVEGTVVEELFMTVADVKCLADLDILVAQVVTDLDLRSISFDLLGITREQLKSKIHDLVLKGKV